MNKNKEAQERLKARIDELTEKLGEPTWLEGRSAHRRVTVDRMKQRFDPLARSPSTKVLLRGAQYLRALQIALEVESASPTWESRKDGRLASIWLDVARFKYGAVRQMAQLKSLEETAFTAFHESSDALSTSFWERVAAEGLPYVKRPDTFDTIQARGRISNRREYNYVVDLYSDLVARGTPKEQLNQWIADFEARSA